LESGATPIIAIIAVACAVPAWAEYEYSEATDTYGQFWEILDPEVWVGVVEGEYYTYEVALEEYIVIVDGELTNVPLECYLYDVTGETEVYLEDSVIWMEYSGDTAVWDLAVGSYYVECEVMVEGLELLHFHLVAIMTQEEYDEALKALDDPESTSGEKTDVSVPGVVDLPPVFVKNPTSETVMPVGNQYTLSLSENDFLVVDDSRAMVECTANRVTSAIGSIPSTWRLSPGAHNVQCTATDASGKTNSMAYTITVVATAGLYASENYEQRLERIARLGTIGALSDEHVLKVVKYFHRAGALVFDIGSSDGVGEAPAQPVCSGSVTPDSVIEVMANTDHANE